MILFTFPDSFSFRCYYVLKRKIADSLYECLFVLPLWITSFLLHLNLSFRSFLLSFFLCVEIKGEIGETWFLWLNFVTGQLLVPLVTTLRYDGAEVNLSLAKSEAKLLHGIIRILTTRSKAQLFATFNEYNNESGNPINKVGTTLATIFLLLF